jgi:glycolate oxidase iron-sulfur subunit
VQLFVGCTGAAFEGKALTAARDLLLALGFEVEVPKTQGCCGALDQHAGRASRALELAQENLAAFGDQDIPVISLNSGCRTQLREYADRMPGPQAQAFAGRVRDLYGFLMEQEAQLFGAEGLLGCGIQPEDRVSAAGKLRRVAVHLPCTLRNVLKEQGALLALLRRVPGLEVVELAGNERCCGAAGMHMVTHPGEADALLAPKIEAVRQLAPEAIVTANIGCSLHFQAGLRRAGLDVPVITGAELIRQWVSA